MALKHNKATAKRSLKWIASSSREGVQCGFACGQYGPDMRVVLADRYPPSTMRSRLEKMEWDGPALSNKKRDFAPMTTGIAELSGSTLVIRCKKQASAAALAKACRIYFKQTFKLTPPWSKVVAKRLTDADEKAFVELPGDDGLITDAELEQLQAAAPQVDEDSAEDDWDDTEAELGSDGPGSAAAAESEAAPPAAAPDVPESGPDDIAPPAREDDLEETGAGGMKPEDVVASLLDYGVEEVRRRNLPYDTTWPDSGKLDKVVRGNWVAEPGEKQDRAVEKLRTTVRALFSDDGRLVAFLGLKPHRLETEASSATSGGARPAAADDALVPPAIGAWQQAYEDAKSQIEVLKKAVVASLGPITGDWAIVNSALEMMGAPDQALQKVVGTTGMLRASAIDQAEAAVMEKLRLLDDDIYALIDGAPFDGVRSLGATLQGGLLKMQEAVERLRGG